MWIQLRFGLHWAIMSQIICYCFTVSPRCLSMNSVTVAKLFPFSYLMCSGLVLSGNAEKTVTEAKISNKTKQKHRQLLKGGFQTGCT